MTNCNILQNSSLKDENSAIHPNGEICVSNAHVVERDPGSTCQFDPPNCPTVFLPPPVISKLACLKINLHQNAAPSKYRPKYFQLYAEYQDWVSDMTIRSQCIRKFDKFKIKYGQERSGPIYQHTKMKKAFAIYTSFHWVH